MQFDRLKRRELLALLASTAATGWPGAGWGQHTPKMPVIGLMGSSSAAAMSHLTAAFLQRLRELGWTEGRDLRIEYRWGEGRNERFAEIAAEFVRLKVDLILTHNTPPTLAAKQATSVIPIVFATAAIRLVLALWQVSRDRAEISPAYRVRYRIQPASVSNFCASLFPICAVWRSWPTLTVHSLLVTWTKSREQHALSRSKPSRSKSGE
jgi:ABC transporter substrate binding protein